MEVPYSAEKDDLYYPAKHALFFPAGRPQSDAALCVEMARLAYCRIDSGFAFDQDRIRKVLGKIEFTGCDFFEAATRPDGGGSHAFLALDADARLAVLSFRGTDKDDPTDLMDDIDLEPKSWSAGGKAHTGFADALMAIWPEIDAGLKALVDYSLLFAGHSLGAAMATLASTLRMPKSLYTIGSPRVGDTQFVNLLKNMDNHRYVDCCDLVTRVPPQGLFDYQHIPGDIHYINFERTVKLITPEDPCIGPDRFKAEEDYLKHYSWRIGDVAVRSLADHAPVNYVLPVTAATP
jgi:Lipase (class 3)